MDSLKFKRNESFYIRDGWLQKAIHSLKKNNENIFSSTKGIYELGIGSNMVKSLKYWLLSANIIESKQNQTGLTEFGNLLYKYDPYLDSSFSWFFIHYFLVTNFKDAPLFNMFFNLKIKSSFNKNDIYDILIEQFKNRGYNIKNSYIFDDFNVFLKSYTVENKEDNPEDNYICPLSSLNLIEKKKKDMYFMKHPIYSELSYLILSYALNQKYKKQFNIEDALLDDNSPVFLFNIDKNSFSQYLDDMKRTNLITINKTAGLNTVYFNEKIKIQDIFKRNFENHV